MSQFSAPAYANVEIPPSQFAPIQLGQDYRVCQFVSPIPLQESDSSCCYLWPWSSLRSHAGPSPSGPATNPGQETAVCSATLAPILSEPFD